MEVLSDADRDRCDACVDRAGGTHLLSAWQPQGEAVADAMLVEPLCLLCLPQGSDRVERAQASAGPIPGRRKHPDPGAPQVICYAIPDATPCVYGQALVEAHLVGERALSLRLICQTFCPICLAAHGAELDYAGERTKPGLWIWKWTCPIVPDGNFFVYLQGADVLGALKRYQQVVVRARREGWNVQVADP
jgi:hypothetical protein